MTAVLFYVALVVWFLGCCCSMWVVTTARPDLAKKKLTPSFFTELFFVVLWPAAWVILFHTTTSPRNKPR